MAQAASVIDLRAKVTEYVAKLKTGGQNAKDTPILTRMVMAFMEKCGYAKANQEMIFKIGLQQHALRDFVNKGRWSKKNPNATRATSASRQDVKTLKQMGETIKLGAPVHKDARYCPIEQLDDMLMLAFARWTGDFRDVAKLQAYRVVRTGNQLPLPVDIPADLLNEMIALVEEEFRRIV